VGIGGLSKPTGYFILPFALFLVVFKLYSKKSFKLMYIYLFYIILGTAPFIVAFFLYGLHYDPEIFWKITSIQSFRPAGFGSLAWFFITPAFDTVILRDSWYVFCLLSAAFFIFNPKEDLKRLVSLSFVYWVAVVMISGGENDLLPWYRFPTFPSLAILGAWGLQYIAKKADFFSTFLAAGMLIGNRMLLVNAFNQNIQAPQYRLIFSSLMLPSVINEFLKNVNLERFCRALIIGILVIGIYINCSYIYHAFDLQCQAKICPIVPVTWLSTLRIPFSNLIFLPHFLVQK